MSGGERYPPDAPGAAVMQPRCVHCKREQYVLAVAEVSAGTRPCVWCGRIAPVFTSMADYIAAVRAPALGPENG